MPPTAIGPRQLSKYTDYAIVIGLHRPTTFNFIILAFQLIVHNEANQSNSQSVQQHVSLI